MANLKVGDRVAVMATQVNGGNLALHVNLIPGKALGLDKDKDEQGSPANSEHMGKGEKGEPAAAGMIHGKVRGSERGD